MNEFARLGALAKRLRETYKARNKNRAEPHGQ